MMKIYCYVCNAAFWKLSEKKYREYIALLKKEPEYICRECYNKIFVEQKTTLGKII